MTKTNRALFSVFPLYSSPVLHSTKHCRVQSMIHDDPFQASKFTLRQVFKTFNVKKSNDFVQAHLVDEGRLYLDEFLSALLRHLADEMPAAIVKCIETAGNYLQGARDEIKPHAPLLIGEVRCM